MRICMVTSSYPRNAGDGAGSYVRALSQALVDHGQDVTVVAPYDPQVAEWDTRGVDVRRFRYAPVDKLHIMGHGRSLKADRRLRAATLALLPGFVTASIKQTMRLHRQAPFDVFHGHWAVPGGPIAAWVSHRTGRPLVLTLHGSDVYIAAKNRLYGRAARFAFDRATQVAGVSRDLLDRAVDIGLSSAKARLAPCGVDTDVFGHGNGQAMRSRLGIAPDAPVVGTLGRLVAKKGFGHLIEAMAVMASRRQDVVCVIGGEGDLDDDLATLAKQRGVRRQVMLPGNIPWEHTPDFYAMCDVVAVPSVIDENGNVDGLPNVLVEAMASARPIVGSDLVGIAETITHEEDGLLVDAADPYQLAEACMRLLASPTLSKDIGHRARQKMLQQYTWRSISAQYLDMYRSALNAD